MAEIVLRDRLERDGLSGQVSVDSTGISDEESGNPVDYRAQKVLREAGYTDSRIDTHAARKLTAPMLETRDLVLTMTRQHYRAAQTLAERHGLSDQNVRMFRSFDPSLAGEATHSPVLDVADPWYGTQRDFVECLAEVEATVDGLMAEIKERLGS